MPSNRTIRLLRERIQHVVGIQQSQHCYGSKTNFGEGFAYLSFAGSALLGSCLVYSTALHLQQHKNSISQLGSTSQSLLFISKHTISCEEHSSLHEDRGALSGFGEEDRFYQCLEFHRSLLPDYVRRWQGSGSDDSPAIDDDEWPKNVPIASEVPALEKDLVYCERSPHFRGISQLCKDLRFRIASYYLKQDKDPKLRKKGYKTIKELAECGHPDSMCLYGIILNEGGVEGVDINPNQATIWWRRCIDFHKHIEATYELAVAMYTGEGVPENASLAVDLFFKAANLGHAGAAYMLGECLLDGVGVDRDRADALEWLVTAAELGHRLARKRVISVLEKQYVTLDSGESHVSPEETAKWVNDEFEEKMLTVNIERRFTIGGGSRNPAVLANRKNKVAESRGQVNDQQEEKVEYDQDEDEDDQTL